MKKLSFFLMAMLVSLTSFAAALGEGYEKVTDISTLAAGDKVVLYCDGASLGVTGVKGNKDAAVAATGWVEYLVEAATGGVKLKDTNANKYISLTSKNSFTYATSGSVCKVNAQGVLYITLSGSNYFLYQNGTYYRMYVDKTGNSGYKPFYVYKVVPVEVDPDATMYTVTVKSADETMGTVTGSGEYAEGSTATLEASPKAGYEFVKWSNESTDNPLKLTVTEDIELTATFQAQTPITIAEANQLKDAATCILKEFTVAYIYKSYIHIQDASGYGMIYAGSFGLKAGDVVTGFTCSKSTFNGLPQFVPSCKLADLTVAAGEAPAVAELTTAPTGNYHQVVKLMNVKMTGSFNTSSATTLTATCPDGKTIAIYNAKNNLAYTFVADKTYNITGDVCQYKNNIQVSTYAIEEYVAPEPCTLATPVNWDAPIAAEANTDQWYAVNVASAIAAGKDLALTVTNPGTEAVEITIEAYADCPATELIVKSTKTFNAGETKTTTVKYDEYLADQVEVVYLHVVTSGDLTIGTEAIEPCSKATAINWNDPIAAAANLDAWYAVNVESAIAAGKDLALTVSNPSTEAVEVSIEAYANCPATELIIKATSTINAGASKTTTVKYDEYLADQVEVVYMHVTTKGGAINVEAETVKFNVTATAENGTVEGAGIYEQGAEATLTAKAAEGYEFVNWTVDGTEVSTKNPYKFTVTADVALVANFKKAAPATETVYFINNKSWSKVNTYAWEPVQNAGWPGAAATKEAEKVAGYDVYSYTAEVGKHKNVIFNNGSSQTADLKWTAGKYYWMGNAQNFAGATKEEAEAALAKPVEYESVYFVNAQGWAKVNIYTWSPVVGTWPGVAMKKETEKLAGKDVYSYTVEKGTSFGGMLFNNGSGTQTGDLKWTAGKYYVQDGWYTKEEAEAKLAAPVVTVWTMVGDTALFGTAWDLTNTANDLVKQEDGSWVLTLKNKTLAAKSYEYKAAKDRAWTTTVPGGGNAKLTISKAGQYDITFTLNAAATSVTAKTTYIPAKYNVTVTAENGTVEGAGEYEEGKTATLTATANEGYEFVNWTVGEEVVSTENPYSFVVTADVALVANFKAVEPEIEWLEMPLEITNLTTEVMEVEGAKYLLLQGRDDINDADVMLFLNNYADVDDDYEVNAESSYMTFGGLELTVLEGVMTQTSETDKGTMYNGIVRTYVAEDSLYVAFNLTMYAAPATVLELTDAIVAINEELGTLTFNVPTGEGEGYFVELSGYTAPGVHEGPQICLFETPEVVAYTNYAETSVADGVITLKGEFVSPMGPKFDVTISGKLPVEEPVEKPEPTYTDNNLNPYAFGLESKLSDDKSTLTMTYRLNNSKATKADVIVKNGQDTIVIVAGTTNIGKNTVEISTEGFPTGVDITWAVIVNGTSVEAPTREEKIYSFYHPSGLDIDNNPENETFGMLLVNEGMHSVASKTDGYVSAQFGAGIFAFTPSFDLIPNGELPGYNGGIEFTNYRPDKADATAYAPRRIRISEDGRIFVTSLNTDGNYLWEVNPENMNEWTTVFKGTLNDQRELVDAEGNFVAAPNNGFDVKGSGENLQLAMYSVNLSGITAAAMGGFRLHEYNLGTATEWATAPSKAIVEGKYAINYTGTQVEYDNEGGLWIASYRGTANDANPGLVHINADGVEDAKLVWSNVRQAGIRFNKDFTKLVVAGNNGAAKKATIYTISKDANGAPVLTQEAVVDMAVVGNNLNDFAWDYAGNLYACGNSAEKLAAWAMPYSGEVVTPAAAKYAFQLEGTGSDYEVYEDEITNLVIDLDNLVLIGGPSSAFQVDVYLPLGEYNMSEDSYQLTSESSIAVMGSDATFIEGYAYEIDAFTPSAKAVVRCEWNGMLLEFHLTMTAEPMEATKVVVENAVIEIEKYVIFGDVYDYALKMTGNWINPEDGLTYPVLVEVPVYYPEATEPSEIMSTVTVGGWGDNDPWLGFGEGTLTVTTVGNVITATGIVQNPMAGVAIDITISGSIINVPDGVENITVTAKPVKMIQNGQLIIKKGDAQYNAQGATVK